MRRVVRSIWGAGATIALFTLAIVAATGASAAATYLIATGVYIVVAVVAWGPGHLRFWHSRRRRSPARHGTT